MKVEKKAKSQLGGKEQRVSVAQEPMGKKMHQTDQNKRIERNVGSMDNPFSAPHALKMNDNQQRDIQNLQQIIDANDILTLSTAKYLPHSSGIKSPKTRSTGGPVPKAKAMS